MIKAYTREHVHYTDSSLLYTLIEQSTMYNNYVNIHTTIMVSKVEEAVVDYALVGTGLLCSFLPIICLKTRLKICSKIKIVATQVILLFIYYL